MTVAKLEAFKATILHERQRIRRSVGILLAGLGNNWKISFSCGEQICKTEQGMVESNVALFGGAISLIRF